MSSIKVPEGYRNMVRQFRTYDDWKGDIKQIIQEYDGKPITGATWRELTGTTSIMAHIKRLIKEGYVSKQRVKQGGTSKMTYKWHGTPLTPKDTVLKNGGVFTKKLDLPEYIVPPAAIDDLKRAVFEWTQGGYTAENVAGAVYFVQWLESRNTSIEEERNLILKGTV